MNAALLRVDALCKHYGEFKAVDGATLDIAEGELHAIIGPNGAGKSTLMNLLSGELRADGGSIHYDGTAITHTPESARAHLGMLRSYQITSVFNEFTVKDNVTLAAIGTREHAFRLWRPMASRGAAVAAAETALEDVGLSARAGTPVSALAYGERRQVELAMALAAKPRLLLLDEPMAGMSTAESAAVTRLLQSLKGRYTIALVEHDMHAVFTLADRITVLASGSVLVTGTPDQIRDNRDVKTMYLGEEEVPQ